MSFIKVDAPLKEYKVEGKISCSVSVEMILAGNSEDEVIHLVTGYIKNKYNMADTEVISNIKAEKLRDLE